MESRPSVITSEDQPKSDNKIEPYLVNLDYHNEEVFSISCHGIYPLIRVRRKF